MLCALLLFGAAARVCAADGGLTAYYEDIEPKEDLYLPSGASYSDFKSEAGWFKWLYLNGDEAGDPLFFPVEWDQAEYEGAVSRGEKVFSVHGEYKPPDPESQAWDETTHDRWDSGEIQIKPGTSIEITVHIRPEDLVTVYKPSPDMQIQTIWIDRDSPPDFSSLYLAKYDCLIQEESPYDTEWLEFSISWDEESYIQGLQSGAGSFEVAGTYSEPFYPETWQQELYEAGLIRTEGYPFVVIQVKNPEEQIYENPYSSRFGYAFPYELNIYIRPDTGFDEAFLPALGTLTISAGEAGTIMEFGLEWDRAEYEAGIAGGEDSFTVSGHYGLNPGWTAEDQNRFKDGRIRIDGDTPEPILTVHLLREDLPFAVKMQNRGGELIPTFTFHWPNGAEEVSWSFSFDKETWYQGSLLWSSEYEYNDAYDTGVVYDEDDRMIAVPEDAPVPLYCKLTVTGSAFAGETKIMKVSPDGEGNWTMDEDQSGDHGGGGQGEHDRPGKEETEDSEASPVLDIPSSSEEEDISEPSEEKETSPVFVSPKNLPAAGTAGAVPCWPSGSQAAAEESAEPAAEREAEDETASFREEPADPEDRDSTQIPASFAGIQPFTGHTLGYIAAAVSTLLLILFGISLEIHHKKKKNP